MRDFAPNSMTCDFVPNSVTCDFDFVPCMDEVDIACMDEVVSNGMGGEKFVKMAWLTPLWIVRN